MNFKRSIIFLALVLYGIGASAQNVGLGYAPYIEMNTNGGVKGGYSICVESYTTDVKVNGKYDNKIGLRYGLGVNYLDMSGSIDQLHFSAYLRFFPWRGTRFQLPIKVGLQYGSLAVNGSKAWRLGCVLSVQAKFYVSDRIAFFAEYNYKVTPRSLSVTEDGAGLAVGDLITNHFLEGGIVVDICK